MPDARYPIPNTQYKGTHQGGIAQRSADYTGMGLFYPWRVCGEQGLRGRKGGGTPFGLSGSVRDTIRLMARGNAIIALKGGGGGGK